MACRISVYQKCFFLKKIKLKGLFFTRQLKKNKVYVKNFSLSIIYFICSKKSKLYVNIVDHSVSIVITIIIKTSYENLIFNNILVMN